MKLPKYKDLSLSTRVSLLAVVILFSALFFTVSNAMHEQNSAGHAQTSITSLCGNPGPAPVGIKHVIVVMMENKSYSEVVGSSQSPFQTSLASQCGVATAMFGATHTSAANYLAVSAGEYPATSPAGCTIAKCTDASNNLYNQLTQKGLSWKGYVQQMPSPCDKNDILGTYQIGHNPILFYSDIPPATCQAQDVSVADLTAQAGAFWTDLQNQTLPSLSWITPHDCDGCGYNQQSMDTWLQGFITTVKQSNSYQAGNTVILVTYDEGGNLADKVTGEDCTNQSLDMPVTNGLSAHQESCHIPFFVIYPYTQAGTHDGTFFDHYSVTKTVEDIFGLPYIAHAADAQTTSLIGHFGLGLVNPQSSGSPAPTRAVPTPTKTPTASQIQHVFVIMMENHNWAQIKGNTAAPYINSLLSQGAHAEQYYNPPGNHPSEPNYLWLEAGTSFGVTNDDNPSVNHQSTTNHLVTLLTKAGLSWKAYQEDIPGTNCPLINVNNYMVHHDPFAYFDDVTNNLSSTSQNCIQHIRPFTELASDLANNKVANYTYITPNSIDDMHNGTIQQGDTWLSKEVPMILNSQAYKSNGVLLITWDEGESQSDGPIGMIVLSPYAKKNYTNTIHYDHSSTLKSVEEIFGLSPLLGGAAQATDLSDFFTASLTGGGTTPTPTNGPTPTRMPTKAPTPTPVPTVVPTITGKPTAIPLPTNTPVPGSTGLVVTVGLHGIGLGGDSASPGTQGNMNPLHPTRTITADIYNNQNQLVMSQQGTITYNSTTGLFTGSVNLGSQFATGSYTVKIKTDQYLRTLVPGIQTINAGQTNKLPVVTLIAGDINGDNAINIVDYNMLVGCYSDLLPATNCTAANNMLADITDDGHVNQFDYNLFLRELTNIGGQ